MWNHVISQCHIIFTFIHIIFIFLRHFGARDPDPGPKNHILIIFLVILFSYYCICLGWGPSPFRNLWKVICTWGDCQSLGTARVSSFAWNSLGRLLRSQAGPKNVKIIWKKYEKHVISQFHVIFSCFHLIFIFLSHFWARDPDPGSKSHIFVIFLVIFFHIIVYPWAGPPVHTAIFETCPT